MRADVQEVLENHKWRQVFFLMPAGIKYGYAYLHYGVFNSSSSNTEEYLRI